MITSSIEIVNLGLIKIGQKTITSFDDGSETSILAKLLYSHCLDVVLEKYVWSFAVKRASLAEAVNTNDWGSETMYQLPADYLRLVELNNQYIVGRSEYDGGNDTAYKLEGNKLLLQDNTADIRYISRESNVELFSPSFIEALSCYLAKEFAEKIMQDTNKRDYQEQLFIRAIRDAKSIAAIQMPPATLPDIPSMDRL